MSIYSGFATRQQQEKYNNLLENLILAFKKRLTKFYRKQDCDQSKFQALVKKIYKQMVIMQRNKFLMPKFSTSFSDIIDILDITIDFDSMSDMSSVYEGSISLDSKHNFLNSNSILKQKKNTIKKALIIRKQQQSSLGYLNNLNKLESVQSVVKIQQPRRYTLIQPPNNNRISRIFSQKHGKSIKLFKSKNNNQIQKSFIFPIQKQIKYGVPVPPQLQNFIPAKQQIIQRVQQLYKQSQSLTLTKIKSKSRDDHRNFRKNKFERSDLNITDL